MPDQTRERRMDYVLGRLAREGGEPMTEERLMLLAYVAELCSYHKDRKPLLEVGFVNRRRQPYSPQLEQPVRSLISGGHYESIEQPEETRKLVDDVLELSRRYETEESLLKGVQAEVPMIYVLEKDGEEIPLEKLVKFLEDRRAAMEMTLEEIQKLPVLFEFEIAA